MKKIIFIFLLTIPTFSYSQLSNDDYKKVESMVFQSLQKDNYLQVNRVTKGGKLSSCELEFGYIYRDYRSQSGKPVIVSGSVSLMYFREKGNLGTSLKIVPSVLDVRTEKWSKTYPEYIDLRIDKKSLNHYKMTDFKCGTENKGRCVGYGDKNFDVVKIFTSNRPFDGEVVFSLVKGGIDNTINLSTLLPSNESNKVRNDFNICMTEVLDEIVNDLDKKK